MKKFLIAASIAALAASPSFAADLSVNDPAQGLVFGGFIDFEFGGRFIDGDDDTETGASLNVGTMGALNIPLSEIFSAQVDLNLEMNSDGSDEAPKGAASVGGHLSLRDPGTGLIGVFGGGVIGASNSDNREQEVGFVTGLEGQVYFDNLTLYAQGGYGRLEFDEAEGFNNGWFARGVVRYFLHDDAMIEVDAAFGQTPKFIDGDNAGNIVNWGLKGKWLLSTETPAYGFVGYRGGRYDTTGEGDVGYEHTIFAGVSFTFGGVQSLKHNDRYGATLSTPQLVGRTASWVEALD